MAVIPFRPQCVNELQFSGHRLHNRAIMSAICEIRDKECFDEGNSYYSIFIIFDFQVNPFIIYQTVSLIWHNKGLRMRNLGMAHT